MPSIYTFIQVRFGSTRLPGKALLNIVGKTMLARVVERMHLCDNNNIVISTTVNPLDDAIVEEAKRLRIPYFRGDEDNCLDRFIQTADYFHSDIIIRVTGDNPFTDPKHLDLAVNHLVLHDFDYVVVTGLPLGVTAEVVKREALYKSHQLTDNPLHHEHITSYIYTHPDLFRIGSLLPLQKELARPDIRLTIDTKEDLELFQKIYESLGDTPSLFQIIELINADPALSRINKDIEQRVHEF